jgi:hypothetical protein
MSHDGAAPMFYNPQNPEFEDSSNQMNPIDDTMKYRATGKERLQIPNSKLTEDT